MSAQFRIGAPQVVAHRGRGEDAETAVGGDGIERIADSFRLERVTTDIMDGDIMVTGYLRS